MREQSACRAYSRCAWRASPHTIFLQGSPYYSYLLECTIVEDSCSHRGCERELGTGRCEWGPTTALDVSRARTVIPVNTRTVGVKGVLVPGTGYFESMRMLCIA